MSKKRTLLSLLLNYRYSFLAGLLALSVVDICQLSIPLVIKWIVDILTLENADADSISQLGLVIIGIAIVMSIFRFAWRYFIMGSARKIEQSVRNDFFAHLQSLNFDFFSERKVGDLMAHTVNDIETLKFACGLGVLIAYDGVFLLIFIFCAMFYISPELTLYAFIPFPLLGFIIYKFGKMIEKRFQSVQDSFSTLTESARESVSAIKVVKAFVREKNEERDFERSSEDYLSRNLHLIKIWGVYQPIITFFAASTTAIFLWIGGISTITLGVTLGDFAAILVYLTMLTWPMMAMGWAVDIMKRGNASLNRINDVFMIKPKFPLEPGLIDHNVRGSIEIKNLNFSYNGKRILEDVSFKIPAGEMVGITGRTGSGKSTLIHLLTRIKEPPEGSLFIDGIDVKKIKKVALRNGIVYVPQETTVFSGTIRDNIAFMNPSVKDSDIEGAAKVASIYEEIIAFPGGFDTIVGERGLSLSGGQRQRIALSRAILMKPRVLILDDVFSSLDFKTESLVLRNLRREMRGRTLLVISSRVPSISSFDSIAVFEKGILVEMGRHESLMANDGIYSGLYNIQSYE